MKKIITLAVLGLFFLSCSNNDSSSDPSPLSETPQAKAEFDNSNFGVYKGVFVGSTGVISINIKNGDNTISAKLVLNGTTYNFTTTETVTQNQVIIGLSFISGSMSFDFYVNASGDDAYVTNIVFSGHPNATIEIIKEGSTAIVKCYEGTFSGTDSGVFNAMVSNGYIYGLGKSNSDGEAGSFFGTVTNNIITAYAGDVTSINGTVSGDNISGTWIETDNSSHGGTWAGHRTL